MADPVRETPLLTILGRNATDPLPGSSPEIFDALKKASARWFSKEQPPPEAPSLPPEVDRIT